MTQTDVAAATKEGARNAAEEAYFKALTQIDSLDRRRVFCAGFDRGYVAAMAEPAPVQRPVATVKSWTNGSHWRNYKLEWHEDVSEGTKLYTTPKAQQPAQVAWGVDWGGHGERSCVSIIKKHADGVHEVVATEYGPIGSTRQPAPSAKVPLLTDDERETIAREAWLEVVNSPEAHIGRTVQQVMWLAKDSVAIAIEQAVRQKAGLK